MLDDDIDAVVDLIFSHDEDDAAEAQRFYRVLNGCHGQFVLEENSVVIGATGFDAPTGCDQSYWITWTYVHDEHTNRGVGRKMLTELFDYLQQQGGRKLFVKVSDYVDPEAGAIYAAALHLYQSMGFSIEVQHDDFYGVGEAQIILGMRLQQEQEHSAVAQQQVAIHFNEIFEIGETEGSWSFGWHEQKGGGSDAPFTAEDLQTGLDAVREEGARCVFLSFPSNYAGIHEPLIESGFSEAGSLKDYYADGIDELHYAYYFNQKLLASTPNEI
jgi:ribosomal protein S18 acetylase RimI-like enzyme